jgi:[pyruvate, water dikinase]-phosphate phosphotransferase / [pyruvate, water dikinase] kinase
MEHRTMLNDEPKRLTMYVVSDGGGATAEAVMDAVTVQFPGVKFDIERHPGVRTRQQVLTVARHAASTGGIIVHTVVMTEIRRLLVRECRQRLIDHVDLIGPLLGQVSQKVGMRPLLQPGVSRALSDDYFQRIEAIQYTVRHDDGQSLDTLDEADIVLLGVSRSSKTPLSIYLSMRGWKVGNIPIVLGVPTPEALERIDQRKIVGLSIDKDELVEIRKHRIESLGQTDGGEYSDPETVAAELAYARRIFRRGFPWPTVDITGKSIEESAKEVISWIESQRVAAEFQENETIHESE